MDESRFGTHSKIGHGWFTKGQRTPIKVKLGFQNFYLYSAVIPFPWTIGIDFGESAIDVERDKTISDDITDHKKIIFYGEFNKLLASILTKSQEIDAVQKGMGQENPTAITLDYLTQCGSCYSDAYAKATANGAPQFYRGAKEMFTAQAHERSSEKNDTLKIMEPLLLSTIGSPVDLHTIAMYRAAAAECAEEDSSRAAEDTEEEGNAEQESAWQNAMSKCTVFDGFYNGSLRSGGYGTLEANRQEVIRLVHEITDSARADAELQEVLAGYMRLKVSTNSREFLIPLYALCHETNTETGFPALERAFCDYELGGHLKDIFEGEI